LGPDATPAAATPAPDNAVAFLSDLNTEQRTHWRLTGERPEPPAPLADQPAASAAAPVTDVTPSTEGTQSAVSETVASPEQVEKGQKLKARTSELEAEVKRLDDLIAERAAKRKQLDEPSQPQPESRPDEEFPSWDQWSADPKNKDKGFDAYTREAVADGLQKAETIRAQQERDRAIERWQQEDAKVMAAAKHGPSAQAIANIVLATHNPALLHRLGSEVALYEKLSSLPPPVALFELGKLAQTLDAPKAEPKPAPKPAPVSTQPPAPVVLGTKVTASSPADAWTRYQNGELTLGDYLRAKNAEEMALAR
jgi:hypothetical protein